MPAQENTFAEACYNQNSIDELREALKRPADETDMSVWGLTEHEYFEQIRIAIKALEEDE